MVTIFFGTTVMKRAAVPVDDEKCSQIGAKKSALKKRYTAEEREQSRQRGRGRALFYCPK